MVAWHRCVWVPFIGAALVITACGDSENPTSGSVEPGPVPAEMCPEGAWPVAAAYDLQTGSFRWAACTPGGGRFSMAAASEDTVWVSWWVPGVAGLQRSYVAFDADSGEELWRGDESRFLSEVPDDADRRLEAPPVLDGVQLSGGQDDPMRGIDPVTGDTLWTQPGGHVAYDDVWAVGDQAVFANEAGGVVAYEVATGAVRWRREGPPEVAPWDVTGERLLAMWSNLQVIATDDGSVLWQTDYPEQPMGFPRMFGGVTNSESVFVSFTSSPSDGD